MGLFTKDIATMDDLLLHGLKDIYYAENQIIKSLPKLIKKATNRDLTKGLKDHLEETKNQVARLDQVFKKLGQDPQGVQCPAIDGLISEADEVAGEVADKEVLDAAIINHPKRFGRGDDIDFDYLIFVGVNFCFLQVRGFVEVHQFRGKTRSSPESGAFRHCGSPITCFLFQFTDGAFPGILALVERAGRNFQQFASRGVPILADQNDFLRRGPRDDTNRPRMHHDFP